MEKVFGLSELVEQIFKNVSIIDLVGFHCVCKNFHIILSDERLWKFLFFSRFGDVIEFIDEFHVKERAFNWKKLAIGYEVLFSETEKCIFNLGERELMRGCAKFPKVNDDSGVGVYDFWFELLFVEFEEYITPWAIMKNENKIIVVMDNPYRSSLAQMVAEREYSEDQKITLAIEIVRCLIKINRKNLNYQYPSIEWDDMLAKGYLIDGKIRYYPLCAISTPDFTSSFTRIDNISEEYFIMEGITQKTPSHIMRRTFTGTFLARDRHIKFYNFLTSLKGVIEIIFASQYENIDEYPEKIRSLLEEIHLRMTGDNQTFSEILNHSCFGNVTLIDPSKLKEEVVHQDGFYLKRSFLDEDMCAELLTKIDSSPDWIESNGETIIIYGLNFHNEVDEEHIPIPKHIANFLKLINSTFIEEGQTEYDQVLISRYSEPVVLEAHVDKSIFGNDILGITLEGTATMELKDHTQFSVELTPGSLYIMNGKIRSTYTHKIRNHTPRTVITFRTLKPPPVDVISKFLKKRKRH